MYTFLLVCELLRPYSYPAFRDDADGIDHRTAIGRDLPYSGMVVSKTLKTIIVQKRGEAAREFLLSDDLAAGGIPKDATGGDRYAFADVLIGDLVVIRYGTFPQGNVCRAVSIHRRPGGRVPAADDDSAHAKHRWHDIANAKQELEEKHLPLPRTFIPTSAPLMQKPSWFSWVSWTDAGGSN
jgi:hypothetical protein